MTVSRTLPEIEIPSEAAGVLVEASAASGGTATVERSILANDDGCADFLATPAWREIKQHLWEMYRRHDYVILRGAPVTEDGVSLLLTSLALSTRFRTYRSDQIVKKFRMSPWTEDLSHSTREGDFHTDLNTEPEPPAVTAIQCLEADPGAPRYGVNRVARVPDLLRELESRGRADLLRFLHEEEVAMANGARQCWTGTIVTGDRVRYHPVTLRDARQTSRVASSIDEVIRGVHEAAMTVSIPFDLRPGDVLFTSNRRALHYRGECSVEFTKFPTDYRSRAIFVLHQRCEPE